MQPPSTHRAANRPALPPLWRSRPDFRTRNQHQPFAWIRLGATLPSQLAKATA
ncbi:hypothetical protein [Chitiniphilus eburneus]|uniref:hypothetical protein n=1 Tax=Chitiniphilus eburneus TaxID=2571148 RepID=UPI00145D2579|nr:hypothetical protein [Chitiniphilus eburneus]